MRCESQEKRSHPPLRFLCDSRPDQRAHYSYLPGRLAATKECRLIFVCICFEIVDKMQYRETKRNKTAPHIFFWSIDAHHLSEVLCVRPYSAFSCC